MTNLLDFGSFEQLLRTAGEPKDKGLDVNLGGSVAETIQKLDDAVASLETLCNYPAWRTPNPAQFRFLQAFAKTIPGYLEVLRATVPLWGVELTAGQKEALADIEDRASELVDTFGWGAEPEALTARLAEAPCELRRSSTPPRAACATSRASPSPTPTSPPTCRPSWRR